MKGSLLRALNFISLSELMFFQLNYLWNRPTSKRDCSSVHLLSPVTCVFINPPLFTLVNFKNTKINQNFMYSFIKHNIEEEEEEEEEEIKRKYESHCP